jgi:hypothetical protein
MRIFSICCVVATCLGAPVLCLSAQNADASLLESVDAKAGSWIDWENKRLHILLSAPVDIEEVRNRSTLLGRKETELRNLFTPLFPLFIQPVRVDSKRSYDDLLRASPDLYLQVQNLRDQAVLLRSQPTSNLKGVTLEYLFALTPHLNALLVEFRQSVELERPLAWRPEAAYTGLVIHAEGKLPWYGTDRDAGLKPALFPRILDEDGRIILDLSRMSPVAARRWGPAAYATGATPERRSERAGGNPLVVTARGVYGTAPTDVIISRDDADTLLHDETSRRALAEGRVIIAVDAAALREDFSH